MIIPNSVTSTVIKVSDDGKKVTHSNNSISESESEKEYEICKRLENFEVKFLR